jgi:hypothetical protein
MRRALRRVTDWLKDIRDLLDHHAGHEPPWETKITGNWRKKVDRDIAEAERLLGPDDEG